MTVAICIVSAVNILYLIIEKYMCIERKQILYMPDRKEGEFCQGIDPNFCQGRAPQGF
jgi:hypothetical protein